MSALRDLKNFKKSEIFDDLEKNEKTDEIIDTTASVIASVIASMIAGAIILLFVLGLSWIAICIIVKLITLCLGVSFKWSFATIIWLIICVLNILFHIIIKK
jgi:hypothetical protein|nr:MAG TPA: hypothetical protein [Caudoviricetes sp.]